MAGPNIDMHLFRCYINKNLLDQIVSLFKIQSKPKIIIIIVALIITLMHISLQDKYQIEPQRAIILSFLSSRRPFIRVFRRMFSHRHIMYPRVQVTRLSLRNVNGCFTFQLPTVHAYRSIRLRATKGQLL